MTVSTTVALNTANGNGSTTVFNFTFRCKSAAEVAVYKDNVKQTSGFTVAVNSNGIGGTVTFTAAPANGVKVAILSDPAFTQLTSFVNAGAFLPQTHDDVNDRAAIRSIRLQSDLTRTMKVPLGETAPNLLASTARAGNYFAFDGSGTPINGISTAVMTDLQDTVSDHTAQIAQEITDRQTADSAETAARVAADTNEATLRAAADAAESSARIGADANETANRIAAVNSEAATRAAADLGLSNTLAAEIGNRTNATNSLLALLAGIALTSATLTAFDRSALAALDHTLGLPAILLTDGGTFVPVTANLATQVTADPNKGIYVPYSSDSTGASGAWVRAADKFYAEHFQATGDGVADDGAKINQAIVTLNALGIGELRFRHPTYYSSVSITAKSNVRLVGPATINSDATYVLGIASSVTKVGFERMIFVQTGASDSKYAFDISGQYIDFQTVEFGANPSTHAVTGYFRNGSAYITGNGFKAWGANGIFVQSHDIDIERFDLDNGGGSDDGWVLKAPGLVGTPVQVYNVRLTNGRVRGFGAAFAFGSECGRSGADDATRENYIRNVVIDQVTVESCTSVAYFKSGAIYDYRDGDVEDISISNIKMKDMSGAAARRWAYFQISRGARVRNIQFNNISGRWRCPNRSSGTNAGIAILLLDYAGGAVTGEIDGIFVDGMNVTDPFGGIANGAVTTAGYNGLASGSTVPGYPIDKMIDMDAQVTGAGGNMPVIKKVELKNLALNGCARAPFSQTAAAAPYILGPVRLEDPIFENYSAGELGSSDRAAILNSATVEIIGRMRTSKAATANAATRGVMGDSQPDKTARIIQSDGAIRFPLGDVAAGATVHFSYAPRRDTWISLAELTNQLAIAAHATNKVTITLDNKDPLVNANLTTKDSNADFAVAANTPVSIAGTNQFTGANAYIRKGYTLAVTVACGGTASLQGAELVIHTVAHGAA